MPQVRGSPSTEVQEEAFFLATDKLYKCALAQHPHRLFVTPLSHPLIHQT